MARWNIINLNIMRKLFTTLLVCITLVFTSCYEEREGEIKVVSTEEMQALLELDDVQLVDVRTSEEYKEGYIAKAQNIEVKDEKAADSF